MLSNMWSDEFLDDLKRVTVVMEDDLHIKVKVHAAKTQESMNDIFLKAIDEYMQRQDSSDSGATT